VLFHFVGGGAQFEYVRAQAARLPNIVLSGVVPHDRMPAAWASADATLIALRDHSVAGGTLPAKLYEGMATGTPVVAAIRGEGEALIGEAGAGIVTPIGDADALTDAIRALANDPARRAALAQAGRRYAEQQLAPDRVKRGYLALLQQITDKNP
jgi:colanic acid biosynthesis glycosyl transferase WcaI